MEMATVLNELTRVKCRGLEGIHKIKKQSPACSRYLHTESKYHNSLRKFWEPERALSNLSKVNSKADLSFIYNREFYEKEAKIGKDDPRYERHKHGIYIDLEKAELFSGLFPELYQKEYKTGSIDFERINAQSKHRVVSFQVDDVAEAMEECEQLEKPHVDLNEVIEIAKQNFTKEDLMGLRTVCDNLDDLPYEEESQLKQSISNETVTSEIDKLLKEKESEIMPVDHTDHHDFRWLCNHEEEEKSPVEPEDITYGWIVSPKAYASYISGNSDQVSTTDVNNIENEFEDVSEVAKFFVENILIEACIIVSSWEKGLEIEVDQAKQIQDATESVDISVGENPSRPSLLTVDIFYEFCPLPIYYKVSQSESILEMAVEATEDMNDYIPLSEENVVHRIRNENPETAIKQRTKRMKKHKNRFYYIVLYKL